MSWFRPLVSLVVVLTAWLISMPVTSAWTPKVVTESYFVPARIRGSTLRAE